MHNIGCKFNAPETPENKGLGKEAFVCYKQASFRRSVEYSSIVLLPSLSD